MKKGSRVLHLVLVVAVALFLLPLVAGGAHPEGEARDILAEAGVQGGLVVHVGCGDGKLTAALWANERYVVHGLDTDPGAVDGARQHIRSLGAYGDVTID